MADFSISLSNIQHIKTIKIEGLGVLKIRKLGAGEDLDVSFKIRRINQLIGDLNNLTESIAKLDSKNPSDLKKIGRLAERGEKISSEIDDIRREQHGIYRSQLSDDKNGAVVDVIMNTLSDKERTEIFKIAFGEKSPIESPEVIDTEIEDKKSNE